MSASRPIVRASRETPDQAAGLRVVRRHAKVVPLHPVNGGGSGSGPVRTFAVTSGKGGVGKTQLSANLAVALAKRGLKVLLLDADLGLASLDLALGLRPEDDLRSVVRGERAIEEILCDGPLGIKLVPACPGRYDMANMSARERQRLNRAVQDLAASFDALIIDTGAGIGSNAVAFAASADEVLLVVTPDPTSMRDAYAMAKVLHRRSGVDRVHIVANQVSSDREGSEMHQRIEGIVQRFLALELRYLGAIPFDDDVRAGVAAGEPYVLSNPSGPAGRAVDGLARRLFPDSSPSPMREAL
ncbi:MAG: P-loop NTPase [Myxococcota bacterium]